MWHKFHWLLLATMSLLLGSVGQVKADTVVYATADNGVTNLFGTIDLTTGLFTQISTTTPLFCSLTAGIGGMIYGGDGNAPLNLYTISPSGAVPVRHGHVPQQSLCWFPWARFVGNGGFFR